MSFEDDLSSASFGAFSVDCTLDGTDGEVILDRDVELVDTDGRVVDRVHRATFLRTFAVTAQHGQALVIGSDSFTIGRRESDDGYVVTFEVHS